MAKQVNSETSKVDVEALKKAAVGDPDSAGRIQDGELDKADA